VLPGRATTALDLPPASTKRPTFAAVAVGRGGSILSSELTGTKGSGVTKILKLLMSWRPLTYSLASFATLALAAGAKWRPR
jgi:hypothetical protein